MSMFNKHLDYHDLTAFEAVSIAAVSFMSVLAGVSLSIVMVTNGIVA